MKSRLDAIEAKLQALIEHSLSWLPRNQQQPKLIESIMAAIRERLVSETGEIHDLPNIFLISLHPNVVTTWQQHSDWIIQLENSLNQTIREAGLRLNAPPLLRFVPNAMLTEDGIMIQLMRDTGELGSTAVMQSKAGDEKAAAQPEKNSFLIINGSEIFPLTKPVTNLGRKTENDLVINDLRVSRSHAQIRKVRGQHILFDLNSTGGTFVNGQRIAQHYLHPGDVISLAGIAVIYGEELTVNNQDSITSEVKS